MASGGIAAIQNFQRSERLSGQVVQLQQQRGSESTESIINRSSTNIIRNQEHRVETLQSSVARGQAMDLYV